MNYIVETERRLEEIGFAGILWFWDLRDTAVGHAGWKRRNFMEIKKPAVAGTMESSDCQVTIEPGTEGIEFELHSVVDHQFGNQIKKVALETLDRLDIKNAKLVINDKGALDCTIKARIEAAAFRSVDQYTNLPWGGAIK